MWPTRPAYARGEELCSPRPPWHVKSHMFQQYCFRSLCLSYKRLILIVYMTLPRIIFTKRRHETVYVYNSKSGLPAWSNGTDLLWDEAGADQEASRIVGIKSEVSIWTTQVVFLLYILAYVSLWNDKLINTSEQQQSPDNRPNLLPARIFIWLVCKWMVLDRPQPIEPWYNRYFYAIVYYCTKIPLRV